MDFPLVFLSKQLFVFGRGNIGIFGSRLGRKIVIVLIARGSAMSEYVVNPSVAMLSEIYSVQKKLMGGSNIGPFAPASGICYSCRGQIYNSGEFVARGMTELITGCPHCHYSFVE